MQPFQIPQWFEQPSGDEILRAIVGTGGSASARAAAEDAVRDLLLPSLEREKGLVELQWRLEGLQKDFERARGTEPVTRLIRIGVGDELDRLEERAMLLAEKRLHMTRWPNEPVPEQWEGILELESLPTVASVTAAAVTTERRLDEIRARYGIAEFAEERSELIIRNYIHVAKTGDIAYTAGPVFDVLSARGTGTLPLPGANPW